MALPSNELVQSRVVVAATRSPRGRAFTLVELLVVVGIITVLVSILMPVLATARERANRVVCASNLRQLGAGYLAYAADFNGDYPALPVGHWPIGAMTSQWPDAAPAGGSAVLFERRYIPTGKAFYCPSNAGFGFSFEETWFPTDWHLTYIDYPSWGAYVAPPVFDPARTLRALVAENSRSPGTRLLSGDLVGSAEQNGVDARDTNHLNRNGKNAGGNVLFNDGSVAWRDFAEMKKRLSMSGDMIYWLNFWF